MEWYWILLIVLASVFALFSLLFVVYITNADLHLVEKIYNWLMNYHNKKKVDTKL